MCSPAHTCLFAALVLGVVVTAGSHLIYAFFLARYAPTCHLELDVHGPGGLERTLERRCAEALGQG